MRIISLLLLLLFTQNFSFSQTHLLSDFCGKYKGTLILDYPTGKMEIPFQIDIEKTENPLIYNNRTTYFINDSTTDVKDYCIQLDTTYKDGKHYILDEKDGILITETCIENTLFSYYSVEGDFYHVKTTYSKKYIDFELTVYLGKQEKTSNSTPDEDGVSYEVKSNAFLTCQHGRLKRVKK